MPPVRECLQCKNPFEGYIGQKEKFCSRKCYLKFKLDNRSCPDCGKERCKKHSRLKTAKWRKEASKKELKAKSMQAAYRQASGRNFTLTLDEARLLIEDPPICPYCKASIPWSELSIDHRTPKSRGGSNNIDNLTWVDLSCNLIKGNLLEEEFVVLMKFMNDHPELKTHLITRLKAGGGFIYGHKSN